MRKLKYLIGAMAALAMFGLANSASADVVGSRHDLTTSTGGAFSTTAVTDQVCVFCHTPHGASATGRPLWNRAVGAGPYTMYDNAFSSTIDMVVAATPQGVSLACLSCHDGTLAFDQLINGPTIAPGAYDYDAAAVSRGWAFTGANTLGGAGPPVELGTDLTDDHPISVAYDNVADPQFNPAVAGFVGSLPLYSGRVECGSCHNPHQTANVPFLRIPNAASALCTTCHIK